MINNENESFDMMIRSAAADAFRKECALYPSDEELLDMFPPTDEEFRSVLKAHRKGTLRHSRTAVPRRVMVAMLAFVTVTVAAVCVGKLTNEHTGDSYITAAITKPFTYAKGYTQLSIGYIPEGYELSETQFYNDQTVYIYCNADGGLISVLLDSSASRNEIGGCAPEQEEIMETVNINGYEAVIAWNERSKIGAIVIDTGDYNIDISGQFTSKTEMIEFAENIR